MAFTTQELREIAVHLATQTGIQLGKPDLMAAVNALDTFLGANESAINNAFPEPFKSTATTPQKAAVLAYVSLKRWGGA